MKKLLLLSCLLLITISSFSKQAKPIHTIKQLTDSIEAIVQQEHIVGLMVGITTKDSVLFSGGFGHADLDAKRKVDENTLFRMGSITKMFVSLGIMKLVNEGKLRLNDELKKIAPEVPFQNKWESTNPVRIVNLLEHTSGFDDIKLDKMYSFDTTEYKGINMVLAQHKSMICRWRPGERVAYSNPNYVVLGYIIEKLSGISYDRFLRENILIPLGMMQSNFNLRSEIPNKDIKEYIIIDNKPVSVESVTLLCGPAGALWSNSSDMLKFIQLFLRDGSPIVPSSTISEIETRHTCSDAQLGQKNGYSLGNENTFFTEAKYPFRGHEGLAGTCFSSCKYNRELGIGYVIASNCNNDNNVIEKLIVNYLEQNLPSKILPTQVIDSTIIEPFLGRYQFESPRNEISAFADKLQNAPKISFEDGKLYLTPLLGPRTELVQTSSMTFAYKGMNMPQICFIRNENGTKIMMIDGAYFKQTSNFCAILKRLSVIVSLLFALTSVILGLSTLFRAISGNILWNIALSQITPVLGFASLLWAIFYLFQVKQYSYKLAELDTINLHTTVIFLGPTLFAIISLLSLLNTIKTFQKQGNQWFAGYLLLTSISLCIITLILWQSGWIGLRTWTL